MSCFPTKPIVGPPGWACCRCQAFNEEPGACKQCGHMRCDVPEDATAAPKVADLALQYARAERDDAEKDHGEMCRQLAGALNLDPGTPPAVIVHAARVSHRAADIFGAQLAGEGRHVVAMLQALRENPARNGVELVAILRGVVAEAPAKRPAGPYSCARGIGADRCHHSSGCTWPEGPCLRQEPGRP